MYIKNFHIEEFGPLENIDVENLPQTMAVFLGDNEAGKSSSMEFIRTMLTGIPNRRDLFSQSIKKFRGGTLLLEDEKYGGMRVERNFSARSNRNLKVYDETGKKIENTIFFNATDNISQDVYRLVFGFNLAELQNFSAFQDTNILENVLGASYGLGLITPEVALQKIQEQMDKLYKAKGKTSVLQALFAKWKDENALFEETNQRVKKFDELQNRLQSATLSYDELKQEKIKIKAHAEELRTCITLWGQWKKWADLQKEFIKMQALTGKFFDEHADDAEILFTKILEQRSMKQKFLASLSHTQREFEYRLKKFNIRTNLIAQYLPIKNLNAKFLEAQKIIAEIPAQKVQIEQAFLALNKQNKKILEAWQLFNPSPLIHHYESPERLLEHFGTVLEDSLFLDDLEKSASRIREAKAQVQNAKTALEYAKRDTEKANLKYQAVLKEKAENNKNLNKNNLLSKEEIAFEQLLQQWQNRLQETQEKENSYLDISTEKYTEFLNQSKELGFSSLQDNTVSKDNAKDFLQHYMQLAQIVRDIHSNEEEILTAFKQYEQTTQDLQLQEEHLQEKANRAKQNGEQDKKRIEKINAIDKATRNIIRQLEQIEQKTEPEYEQEALPKWTKIPALLCAGTAFLLLLLRFTSSSSQVDIFFGTLNIPFLLPVILLLAGIGQGAFLWYFQQKNAGQSSYSPNEQVDLLVHDLQELQDIQEKLLQNFYPEQAKELPQNEAAEKQNEMLHFDEELLQKIDEAKLSWLTQVIEKAKERASLYSHYAKKFNSGSTEETQENPDPLQNHARIAELKEQAEQLEKQIRNSLSQAQDSIRSMADVPNFMKTIRRLDLLVQDINTMSVNVRQCHDVYNEFTQWLKTAIPQLSDTFAKLPSEEYLPRLIEYRHTIREEQFKHIQEMHGAIFAESLASLEESAEHYANVEKSLTERKNALEKIYKQLADFLCKNGLLSEDMHNQFVRKLCNEEQEQDIFSGTFSNVKQCVEMLYHLHTLHTEQENRKEQLSAQYEALKDFIEPLRTILIRTDFSPKEPIRTENDYIQAYRDLMLELEEEYALFQQKENLLKEYEQAKERYNQAKTDVQEVEKTLRELYASAHVENEEALADLFARMKESERYTQQAVIIEESLREEAIPQFIGKSDTPSKREYRELPDQKPLPEIFAYFDENAKTRFEAELEELQEEDAGLDRIEKHIQSLQGKVEAERTFMYEESLSNEAGYRMKKTEEEIKENYESWLEYAFAKEILERAKKQYEENSQPQIVQIASEFFTEITDNAWQGIKVNLDDRSVHVIDGNGKYLQAEMLSQGAKEQLYLSLRLAHIKNRSLTKRPLPILMDDILVNFDERRIRNTAKVLDLMVQETLDLYNNQQILFYTCHERTAKILQEIVQGTKIYRVQDKKIHAE